LVAKGLLGEQAQLPPAFSAKKVAGRRAYEAARAGESVELAARTVHVHAIEVVDVQLPEVAFTAEVSTGTYVRSLTRDLGRNLGCGAHLKSLRRVSIGPYRVADAVSLCGLQDRKIPTAASLSAARSLFWLPIRHLSPSEVEEVEHGRRIPERGFAGNPDLPVAMVAGDRLVGVARRDSDLLQPEKVFHG
jgi:tRNA pseudouridine55 synthase